MIPSTHRQLHANTPLVLLTFCLAMAGCAGQPAEQPIQPPPEDAMRADFSGSWQRNYIRDETINGALGEAYDRLLRQSLERQQRNPDVGRQNGPSLRDRDSLVALARLAEMITRNDVVTIVQDDYEVRVDRKDDFSLLCSFYDGVAQATISGYGRETCAWEGRDLVSTLTLPDRLTIVHRFTISEDRQELRIITTISSSTSPVPFTVRRFYTRFDRPAPRYECIETLSMKRVCSTGDLAL